jgi:hypothetical protein
LSSYPLVRNFVDGTISVKNLVIDSCAPFSYDYVPPKPDFTRTVWNPDFESFESPKPNKDPLSFRKAKKLGLIKMTPYSRYKRTARSYPVGVQVYSFALGWPACGSVFGSQIKAVSSWVENHTYNGVSVTPDPKQVKGVIPDVDSEINSLRSNVVKSNLLTYDVLTDLAEAKETAELIMAAVEAVRHPIESFLHFKKSISGQKGLSPKKINKMLEEKWMEYRYGIMPLYYSIRDIVKTLKDRNNVFKTDRAQKLFDYTVGGKPTSSFEGIQLYSIEHVTLRLAVTGKASYDPAQLNLRLFDQIGLNPFATAWELIPYSFVADWFANVGDWVLAQTAAVTDGAQQRVFCSSVKEVRVKKTYLMANITYKAEKTYSAGTVVAGPFNVKVDELLYEENIESYSRSSFDPSDVKLQSDVFLNWKRAIDAWVLGKTPVINGLRRLR